MAVDPTDAYLHGNLGYMLYKNFEYPDAATELALVLNGGQTSDGQAINSLPLTGDDTWITQYYYTYDILLAQLNRCSEVLSLTQSILGTVPGNEFAVYNANYAEQLCAASLGTPSPKPSATPTLTPTP